MKEILDRAREALSRPGAALIVDIDGTLADDRKRAHLRPSADPHCLCNVPKEAIERYMNPRLVREDEPIRGAAEFLASFGREVVLVTARWDLIRGTTTLWVDQHFPRLRYRYLLMRQARDFRKPSVDVKLALVTQRFRAGVWLDDDPAMLEAADKRGFVPLKAPDIYEVIR